MYLHMYVCMYVYIYIYILYISIRGLAREPQGGAAERGRSPWVRRTAYYYCHYDHYHYHHYHYY